VSVCSVAKQAFGGRECPLLPAAPPIIYVLGYRSRTRTLTLNPNPNPVTDPNPNPKNKRKQNNT